MLALPCCTGFFSSCSEPLCAGVSHYLSCRTAGALGRVSSRAQAQSLAHRPGCSGACGHLPGSGIELMSPPVTGRFFKLVALVLFGVQSLPPSIIRTFSASQTETLSQTNTNLHFPLPSASDNLYSAFCLPEFDHSRYLTKAESQYLSFCVWLISLTFPRFLHVTACVRISFLSKSQ